MRNLLVALALASISLLAGCGTPGAPLPPTLDLPQPPSDLKATRKGDRVTLTWTVPTQTTDRALAKHLGTTRICRSQQRVMADCTPIGEVSPAQLLAGKPASFTDTLPAALEQQNPTGSATYAVEVQNARGRTAGLSNQVLIPLAPTYPPPAVSARVTADGPYVFWRPVNGCSAEGQVSCVYRVRRRLKDEPVEKEVGIADVQDHGQQMPNVDYELKVTDTLAEWEKTYIYRVTPITRVAQAGGTIEVEGDDSQPVEVFAHDVFPPAPATGVQAVYSGLSQQKFIDLTWAPNTDNDLTGYYVYRHEQGTAPVRISPDLVKTPAFRDGNIQPGHTYYYSVTAIDLRGNESQKSAETSEKVPE
jgi:hypothetical protein